MDITLSDWIWLYYVAVYKFIYRCRVYGSNNCIFASTLLYPNRQYWSGRGASYWACGTDYFIFYSCVYAVCARL